MKWHGNAEQESRISNAVRYDLERRELGWLHEKGKKFLLSDMLYYTVWYALFNFLMYSIILSDIMICSIFTVWYALFLLSDMLYSCCLIICSIFAVWYALFLLSDMLYFYCLICSIFTVWYALFLLSDMLYFYCLICSIVTVWYSLFTVW